MRSVGMLTCLILHTVYLFLKIPRRIQPAALPTDDDLFQTVGGRYHHRIFPPIFMGKFLDVLVSCLRFFRKDYMNVVVIRPGKHRTPLSPRYRGFPDNRIEYPAAYHGRCQC